MNRLGLRKDILFCMRQEDTWNWPSHLGEKTAGKCSRCEAAVYYEKHNEPFVKVCHVCGGL